MGKRLNKAHIDLEKVDVLRSRSWDSISQPGQGGYKTCGTHVELGVPNKVFWEVELKPQMQECGQGLVAICRRESLMAWKR